MKVYIVYRGKVLENNDDVVAVFKTKKKAVNFAKDQLGFYEFNKKNTRFRNNDECITIVKYKVR